MKVCVIDNEKNIVNGLKQMIAVYCPDVQQVIHADSVASGLDLLGDTSIDVLFLDVELDDGTGMDLLKQLDDYNFAVVFMTAYDKYAVDAFKFSAIDFLLKPIDPDDLIEAIDKVKSLKDRNASRFRIDTMFSNLNEMSLQEKKIVISDKDFIRAIKIADIYYLNAEGAYTSFITRNGKLLSSKNLKLYEELLGQMGFIRTHHSFLVNLRHMRQFDKSESALVLENDDIVPVSHRKKEKLMKEIKNLSIL